MNARIKLDKTVNFALKGGKLATDKVELTLDQRDAYGRKLAVTITIQPTGSAWDAIKNAMLVNDADAAKEAREAEARRIGKQATAAAMKAAVHLIDAAGVAGAHAEVSTDRAASVVASLDAANMKQRSKAKAPKATPIVDKANGAANGADAVVS